MEDVEEFFKGFGSIKSINLKPGYGFVDFESIRDAEDAVRNCDGKRMCGETVDIQHAKGPGHKKARDRYSGGGGVHSAHHHVAHHIATRVHGPGPHLDVTPRPGPRGTNCSCQMSPRVVDRKI